MRFSVAGLLLLLFLQVSCVDSGSRVPTAVLKVPACVLAGAEVTFDAGASTDPDGRIVRYIFGVDDLPLLVNNQPELTWVFAKPKVANGQIEQYVVRLSVLDEDGFRSTDQAHVFVVDDLELCPEAPPPVLPDTILWDAWEPDVVEPEAVPDDAASVDVVPDIPQKPDTGGLCPNITGSYRVQVFCFATVSLELDLGIQQADDCTFTEEFGIVEGSVAQDGTITLQSPFADLNMSSCEGLFDDPENFSLDCTSGCTAVFLTK